MTHQEFDMLIRRVETGIGRDAEALHKKVASLAMIGFVGVLLPLACVVVLAALFILPAVLWAHEAWGLFIIGGAILLLGGWSALRPLWMRLPEPEGRTLTRAETPALFAVLDELGRELSSASFDRVLLTTECNASVVQLPRLGVFGWYRNYLLIGLPLMEALSKEEFCAVLAHEFAHLSRHHGKSSQWIYRLRKSWTPVFTHLSRPRMANEISLRPFIRKFVDWHWPRFNAHAFVLSRAYEYQADAEAARVTSAAVAAAALLRLDICAEALQRTIWPEIWRDTASIDTPPAGVFSRIAKALTGVIESAEGALVERALLETTTNADTHPCLSDRLRAMGLCLTPPDLVRLLRVGRSAAEELFGGVLATVCNDVEVEWQNKCKQQWRQQHIKANALNNRLDNIDQVTTRRVEDADVLWDKVNVVAELQGDPAAVPLIRQVLELQPRHVGANFALGHILLQSGNGEGEEYIERAIAQNEELLPQASERLHSFYRQTGQTEKIRELYARMDQFEKAAAESRKERSDVSSSDTFIAHGLNDEELRALRAGLTAEPDVIEADLAQKKLLHFVQQRLYVLSVYVRPTWYFLPSAERQHAVIASLTKKLQVPGRLLIIPPNGAFRGVARKVRKTPQALIFNR